MARSGCLHPALVVINHGCGLIAVDTLDRMRASAGSRLDAIKYFPMPKVISGVGKDAVAIVGTQRLPLHAPDGRPVTITAGVMTNGNTGVADLLCGNWHMRQAFFKQLQESIGGQHAVEGY